MVREQHGVSDGHFWDSLHEGAVAETSMLNKEVMRTMEDISRAIGL